MPSFLVQNKTALLVFGLICYFLANMFGGHNGLQAQWKIKERLKNEKVRLEQLNKVKKKLDKKTYLLAADKLAEDYLDELSRKTLGYSRKNERILWLNNKKVIGERH